MTAGYIISGGIELALILYVSFLCGRLVEIRRSLRETETEVSWASIELAQAAAAIDFSNGSTEELIRQAVNDAEVR